MDRESAVLKGLNDAQKEAVRATEGPSLIIAGAGSGKTRALTHRIAYLLSRGVPPHGILALTFTNKAAGEMRGRVHDLCSDLGGVPALFMGTFHALGARILRKEGRLFLSSSKERSRI